jgi:fibrillarin-like pre-rRNA processing protein
MSFKDYKSNKTTTKPRYSSRGSKTKDRGSFKGKTHSSGRSDYNKNSKPTRSYGNKRDNRGDRGGGRDRFKFNNKKRETPIMFKENTKEQFTVIKFPNTYIDIKRRGIDLFTKNLTPGITFFGERTFYKNIDGESVELRNWEFKRSKLGAAIALKVSQIGLEKGSKVLYLGASHGFTPSFVSDMVGEEGFVFCLDFAPRVVRDLYLLCQKRKNMAPIIADANKPEEYEKLIPEVDVIFMDIAQREQVKIFLKNFRFLKKGGFALLALKARSIDVTKKPKDVFREARAELEKHVMIVDYKELDPLEKDHCFFVCKNK